MSLPDNKKLLQFSLDHPEPTIDPCYVKTGNLIISTNPQTPTELMEKNLELLECLAVFSFARKTNNTMAAHQAIEKILNLMKTKNINYSEFVSFWPVVDISYSLFNKLDTEDQKDIMKKIMEKYVEMRHGLYGSYGYTPTTLQVGKDAKAHKESGSLGNRKVGHILEQYGYANANHEPPENFFSQGEKKYIEADKKGKKLFKKLLLMNNIKFLWSKKKERKMPDFLLKSGKHIFIVEHKHMKEGGGGQDKQINEVISFVSFTETNPNIHFVTFLDGLYFNLFANKKYLRDGKILTQIKNIEHHLKRNGRNYFVNTAGFEKLIQELG